jgi:hypothetical protein
MGNFLPLSIKLVDGKAMSVSSICEAEVALQGQWPNKAAAPYKDACRLIAAAKEGSCKPSIAFAAFKAAAIDQRLLLPAAKSAALKMLDDVSGEIQRYDEAVISRSTNPWQRNGAEPGGNVIEFRPRKDRSK